MADRTLDPQSGRGGHPPLHDGGLGEQCTVLLKHQVRWFNSGVVHEAHRMRAQRRRWLAEEEEAGTGCFP